MVFPLCGCTKSFAILDFKDEWLRKFIKELAYVDHTYAFLTEILHLTIGF